MIVTILSDFGSADYFVGAMKGVVLSHDPRISIVDLTHEVPPHDIAAGAFTLLALHRDYPRGTVHLAVVDPSVGSARHGLVVDCGGQRFVGPDNGLFSYVIERAEQWRAFRIGEASFLPRPVSSTFHGRDVFAPVAAHLATGLDPARVGLETTDCERLSPLRPAGSSDALQGVILHVDRFGNCVTNLTPGDLPGNFPSGDWRLEAGGHRVRHLRRFYAEGDGDAAFAIWGSAGFLELSVEGGSAARLLGVGRGDPVVLRTG